ncbi:MAG: hypothetical protein B5M49_03110 [Thermotoga sp. 4484_232]|nr:MAG: hypothetical protein B5M49_03110 [Thermotoga sp. 4484_232]
MRMYVVGIDQGTTSTRSILFNEKMEVIRESRKKFKQIFPKPGWVEHDPEEIWKTVEESLKEVLDGIPLKEVAGIGITNQRETIVAWDSKTGDVLYNAIVWQCRRTAERVEELRKRHYEDILEKTGLVVDPYFSATKMEWMLKNVDEVKKAKEKGTLRFGTIDSFLAYRLTGEHVTDPSNASRTMLFNLKELKWDEDLLKMFGIPEFSLPRVINTSEVFGRTKEGIPVGSLIGDQQSALFGQASFKEGDVKCTMGTGSFILRASNEGVYLVPAFTGLGAPHWDPYARGLMIGLTRGVKRENIVRACFEAIAFSIFELVDLMKEETEKSIRSLKVDGGVAKNELILKLLSSLLKVEVERPVVLETTAFGAAFLAGMAVGIFEKDDLFKLRKIEKAIMEHRINLREDYKRWRMAVERAKNWAH